MVELAGSKSLVYQSQSKWVRPGVRPTWTYMALPGLCVIFGVRRILLMKPLISFAIIIVAAPLSAQVQINGLPSREFGQALLANPATSNAPNLIEGREFNGPMGIAFDYSVNPPGVYIADFANNRVLGWNNASSVTLGNPANVVIGQQDFVSNLQGGPGTSESTGLSLPAAVAVDTQGNLYVADAGNNRILRYPKGLSTGSFPNLVIGQVSFSSGGLPTRAKARPAIRRCT